MFTFGERENPQTSPLSRLTYRPPPPSIMHCVVLYNLGKDGMRGHVVHVHSTHTRVGALRYIGHLTGPEKES